MKHRRTGTCVVLISKYSDVLWKLPQQGQQSVRLDKEGNVCQGVKASFQYTQQFDCVAYRNNEQWFGFFKYEPGDGGWNKNDALNAYRVLEYASKSNVKVFVVLWGKLFEDETTRDDFIKMKSDSRAVLFGEKDLVSWIRN